MLCRMGPRAYASPVAVCLLLLFAPLSTRAGEETPQVEVPLSLPVELDGRVLEAEWEGALRIVLADGDATLRLGQRDGMLFLGLTSLGPWPEGATLWLALRREAEDTPGIRGSGTVLVDFEPREHHRPHLLVTRVGSPGGEAPLSGAVVARAQVDGPEAGVEVAFRLGEALGPDPSFRGELRLALAWRRGAGGRRVSWPPELRFDARAGEMAPDLESSARWGRLGGWRGLGGPGGVPQATWEQLLAEDAELARRGQLAHDVIRRIVDGSPPPKRDGEVLETVRDNLRWIADREPLTGYDLVGLARTYAWLNRHESALVLLDALALSPAWRTSTQLLYARAQVLEAADRWSEAAEAWERLADRSREPWKAHYAQSARRAGERQAAFAAEVEARARDLADSDLPLVLLRTTRGDVVLQLFAQDVPKGVAHFLDLIERREDGRGFYDGTRFHRVEGGFVAQGGDPTSREDCEAAGTGKGPTSVEVETNSRHGFWRGAVGFARAMALVNESQFFVLTGSRPELGEQDFTCFGHVVAGMDVVDRLEVCDELLEARVIWRGPPARPAEGGDR